jgi:CO dehydrogenase/acetyl-CoA synthase beta subunit
LTHDHLIKFFYLFFKKIEKKRKEKEEEEEEEEEEERERERKNVATPFGNYNHPFLCSFSKQKLYFQRVRTTKA